MNTVRSVGYGWGVLIVAGGGSYYFAKKQINKDREARAMADEKRRQTHERLRAQEAVSRETALGSSNSKQKNDDHPSPSREGPEDPAPVSHTEPVPKSRYEAQEPFRSRKGDRFS